MKVYLDDERTPPAGWKLVKTPKEVIDLLKTGKVTELSLDHDLGDDKNIGTGYDVLLWIEKQVYTNGFKPPKLKVHSANISARTKMELAIKSINKKINESINLDVEVGDTILMGKFLNKKVVVKNIGKDEHGMPTINGKSITRFRITKQKEESEMKKLNEFGLGHNPQRGSSSEDNYSLSGPLKVGNTYKAKRNSKESIKINKLKKIIKEEIKKVLSESKRYSISFTTDKEKSAVNILLKSLFKYIDVSPYESEYVIDVYDKFDKIESLLNNLKSKYKGLEVKRK